MTSERGTYTCARQRGSVISLAIACLLLMLTGCSAVSGPNEARDQALRKAGGDVVIGVVWPFARQNDQFREGLELALAQINEQGILGGNKIRLLEQDDEGLATKGMAIAQQFAERAEVSAVIGHRGSSVTVPASRIYDHAGIVLLSPASTAPKLTDVNSAYIFRNIPNDNQLGQALAMYAARMQLRNVAIYYTDDEYGRGLANAFEDQATRSGLKVVDRLSGYKDASDVVRMAEKWKTLDSELVMVAAGASEGAAFISELRAAGLELPIIGGDALDSDSFAAAGTAVEGVIAASVYDVEDRSQENTDFQRLYKERYDKEPGKWAAQAYDSLRLLAEAIDLAGSRSPSAIAAAIAGMNNWRGAAGAHTFDAKGDVHGVNIVMKKLDNGIFHRLDEVVIPDSMQQATFRE